MSSVAALPRTAASVLAQRCVELRWGELDIEVRERTLELLLDLLGVALIGSRQPSSQAAEAAALALGGPGPATVIGARAQTTAAWAAMANGTAAHAIELDDVTTESSLHPGVAVIPAALALAEQLGAPPTAMLEAIIAGYELTMRVGNALNPASAYARGFHPTGVAGIFGATAAAGRLLGLDVEQLTSALGIAGTMASGSLEYLTDGAWTKRLNPGWAGHAGIVAAQLARASFVGPSTVLEGRLGVLHAFSDDPKPARLLADSGGPLQVMRVSIKPYACCRYSHGLIDGVLQLVRQHHVQPADIARVRLGVLSGGAVLVADPIEQKRDPHSVVDAQFSAPYAAAVALAFGIGGIDAYAADKLSSPVVRQLMARTDCYRDDSLDAEYPRRWPAAVQLRLHDGRVLDTRVDFATGEPQNPVSRAALIDKFVSLAADTVTEPRALADRILSIDRADDVRGLGTALRG